MRRLIFEIDVVQVDAGAATGERGVTSECPHCKCRMTLVFDHIARRAYLRCFFCWPGSVS
jgi:hypothetical protein